MDCKGTDLGAGWGSPIAAASQCLHPQGHPWAVGCQSPLPRTP